MSMKYFFNDQQAFSGLHPLSGYLDLYALHLYQQGYCRNTGRRKIRMIIRFSLWLDRYGLAVCHLTYEEIEKYLNMTAKKEGHQAEAKTIALSQFMKFLQANGSIAEQEIRRIAKSETEQIVNDFAVYLKNERGLTLGTVRQYTRHVYRFVDSIFGAGKVDLSTLNAKGITGYVQIAATLRSLTDAKLMTAALRSFLRYAQFQAFSDANLADSVLPVANWARTIPKTLALDSVEKVLACCNRETTTGLRDYTILLLLARLGLRAGEIVSLRLEDIDW